MLSENSGPIGNAQPANRLLGKAEIVKTQGEKGVSTVISQEAIISGKTIKITLTFDCEINDPQEAMKNSLEKVSLLTVAYKLGEVDKTSGQTTRSLTLNKDSKLTRIYTEENSHQFLNQTYEKHEVDETLSKVKNYIAQNPIGGYAKKDSLVGNASSYESLPGGDDEIEDRYFPPPVPSRPILANQPREKGKLFQDIFKINNTVAIETVERAETMSRLIDGLKAKIADLEKTQATDPEAKKALIKARNDLINYSKHAEGVTHGSTNTPRFAFLAMGRDTAKKEMAPILSNLRMQTVKDANGNVVSAVTRSAAITDFRNGEVSLKELRDLNVFEGILNPKPLKSIVEGRPVVEGLYSDAEEKLRAFYLKDDKSPEKLADVALLVKTKALVGYGTKALVKDGTESPDLSPLLEKIQSSSSSIEDTFNALSKEDRLVLKNVKIDGVKLQEVMKDRSSYLKQLALQDLQVHLETTPVKGEGPILYGRTALVDLQKQANNESGCIIHERSQGLDMKAIFDELEGAKLIFEKGLTAAYVDEEGTIHMPKTCAAEGVTKASLNSVFFNICVQGAKGHTLNEGMQKVINDEALAKLKPVYGETGEYKALVKSLNELSTSEKFDPNASVLLVTQFLQKYGGYSGINCYGGKDRTGYAVALITHAKIAELAGLKVTDPKMGKIGHKLLSPKANAAKVAQDNADHTTMKLTRLDLQLYDTGTVKGTMLRIVHGVNGVFLGLLPILRKMAGRSPLSVSQTPGQIYQERPNIQTSNKTNNVFYRFLSKLGVKKLDDDIKYNQLEIEYEGLE